MSKRKKKRQKKRQRELDIPVVKSPASRRKRRNPKIIQIIEDEPKPKPEPVPKAKEKSKAAKKTVKKRTPKPRTGAEIDLKTNKLSVANVSSDDREGGPDDQLIIGYVGYVPGGMTIKDLLDPVLRARGISWSKFAIDVDVTRQNLCSQLEQQGCKVGMVNLALSHLGIELTDIVKEIRLDESKDL